MIDHIKWGVSVFGGLIAIALAVAASLPAPLVIFDKVVVGALLAGGFTAFGVSVNIAANVARERAARRATYDPALKP